MDWASDVANDKGYKRNEMAHIIVVLLAEIKKWAADAVFKIFQW